MIGPKANNRWKNWVTYQVARCIRFFRSCRLLLKAGQYPEALALGRGILDSLLLVDWVAEKPEENIVRVIEGSTWGNRQITLKAFRDARSGKPEQQKWLQEKLDEIFSEIRPKGIPHVRQLAENFSDKDSIGLVLYGGFYSMSSTLLHGDGGELQYIAGFSGHKDLPFHCMPCESEGFDSDPMLDMTIMGLFEIFKVAIIRAMALFGERIDGPPISQEFEKWCLGVMEKS